MKMSYFFEFQSTLETHSNAMSRKNNAEVRKNSHFLIHALDNFI